MFEGLKKNLIKAIQDRKVICINCNSQNTLKIIQDKFTTWKCKCGVQIFYPANAKRDYGTTIFISYIEHTIFKFIKEENLNIKDYEKFKEIYFNLLKEKNILSEPEKLFKNFKKRGVFLNARLNAKTRVSNSNN